MATLLAAPASAAAFDSPQRPPQDEPWADPADEDAGEAGAEPDAGQADEPQETESSDDAAAREEEDAVDICAVAAEREASVDGYRGRVREIGQVQRVSDGWKVEGVVETGRGLLGLFRDETLFTCFARGGRAENVHIEKDFDER